MESNSRQVARPGEGVILGALPGPALAWLSVWAIWAGLLELIQFNSYFPYSMTRANSRIFLGPLTLCRKLEKWVNFFFFLFSDSESLNLLFLSFGSGGPILDPFYPNLGQLDFP